LIRRRIEPQKIRRAIRKPVPPFDARFARAGANRRRCGGNFARSESRIYHTTQCQNADPRSHETDSCGASTHRFMKKVSQCLDHCRKMKLK
jgi:hypothetical protein